MHQLSAPRRPEDLLLEAAAGRAETPLVGWYAGTGPARTELSARSLTTWAAKTVGLFVDEGGLEPGARVLVDLPSHWVTVAVVAGVWAAGLHVVTTAGDGVEAAVVAVGHPGAAELEAAEVFLVDPASPWQLGGLPGLDGTDLHDLALALRPHPDRLPGRLPGGPADPALDGVGRADLVDRVRDRAAALGLEPGARLGWTGGLTSAAELTDAVLGPWAVGGSVVLLPGATDDRLAALTAAERLTRVAGGPPGPA